jgi:hypothetical protein
VKISLKLIKKIKFRQTIITQDHHISTSLSSLSLTQIKEPKSPHKKEQLFLQKKNSISKFNNQIKYHFDDKISSDSMSKSNIPFNFANIQPKLKVSQPSDPYEQEADRIAEQVMSMSIHSKTDSSLPITRDYENKMVRRQCASCEKKKKKLQDQDQKEISISRKKNVNNATNFAVSEQIANEIEDVTASGGKPLDTTTREFMESRFDYDFGKVRIHDDKKSSQSARSLNALAYTVGSDILFSDGQYNPNTSQGKNLLAHELVHVIQQNGLYCAKSRINLSEQNISNKETPEISDWYSQDGKNHVHSTRSILSSSPFPSVATIQRKISDKVSTIRENLTSERNAHDVLIILKNLSDADLKDTMVVMEEEGLVERFFANLSEGDIKSNQEELRRIKNFRVYKRVSKVGQTTVTTSVAGSCSPEQFDMMYQAAKEADKWLVAAISQIDGFKANPKAATRVGDAIKLHFQSIDPKIVTHIKKRLKSIQSDMNARLSAITVECHGSWDRGCHAAGAYVPGTDRKRIVFCNGFFGANEKIRPEIIIHEMAHTLVGGAHITDRGYESDRILRFLTKEERLTNAESYGLLVKQLWTGDVPRISDFDSHKEDCPSSWKGALDFALAKAQRWNRNAQTILNDLKIKDLQKYGSKIVQLLGGSTQTHIDTALQAVDKLYSVFKGQIDIECEPDGGGRCSDTGVRTYWYAWGDLHICPIWYSTVNWEDRILALLAGLYGQKAEVDNNKRRWDYAHLAKELGDWRAPALGYILGNS